MDDNSTIPFGKYKGTKMANVPADYLLYLLENRKCYGSVRDYIKDNKGVLKKEVEQNKFKK